MNRYGRLFFNFHKRYRDLSIRWRNNNALRQGKSREVTLSPHSLCAQPYSCVRLYSSLGVNLIPENAQDMHSDGVYDTPQNNKFLKLGECNPWDRPNFGQHQSSPTNQYASTWTTPQNHSTDKIEVNRQYDGYYDGGKIPAVKQISDHQNASNWLCLEDPSSVYAGNRVAYHPGSYQQAHVSSNGSAPLPNSNGYSNIRAGQSSQNLNGTWNPNVPGGYAGQSPQNLNGTWNPNVPGGYAGQSPQNLNGTWNPNVPGGYQLDHVSVNGRVSMANSSGYHNVHAEPSQQNSNGTHNPNVPGGYRTDLVSEHGSVPLANSSGYYNAHPGLSQHNFNGTRNPNVTGGYQLDHVSVNGSGPSANSSGYHNVHAAQQNFNEAHNPNVLPQSQVSPTPWQSTENGEFDNGADEKLEELVNFCKDWNLISAVDTMRDLSNMGVRIGIQHYLILMDACGKAKALKEAKDVHQHLISFAAPVQVSVFNKILEMYGKCGSMEDAFKTFDSMRERNMTTWDTMITWLSKNGLGEDAIDMFSKFKEAGLKPDGLMFLGVFDACGVLGDVTEGLLHFDSMVNKYGITPTMTHYARIVHMFGSACDLDGALEFIEKMPVEPSIEVWESLMNIARVQGNVEIGDRSAQIVEQLDPTRLNKDLRDGLLLVDPDAPKKKVKKYNPLEHISHDYRAGDQSHPEKDKIYAVLRGLKEIVKEAGYIPETKFVLHDIDPEGKEETIMAHSERLAAAYALITSGARHQFRVIKNLRVCGDCHNYFKILSDIVGREIIMRDAKRFHHFKDGKCSCNDYW
ncbi:pentatricopeptide repeat-containing protein At4g32450, mitochondrial-like [Amaranthus tricolor]|uniref:pentatricopeptide repeat-containing protein At4g32450, mitochondrial-like n=1 Tax=Amaranthus tricolor TaxID=29722 RepID=UPI002589D524|nr:pentatricopeptide repeat-containing protein At4g32450, mitochondrial-like [Amaranthus tricolor]XP_057542738.1 pentatricopeptide repeat-containing protein At4g32450, mitochondrial-like [Amaranthus tricolor]XP_057542739.1 pentatricopeptide repeat-containing protein At4g32450, mitochondrial-like [Amaranthus tricolor]XP_057542740.1 pentatricopeptide repeat-containing protein At4g32450, mitochondrial-like [Amaranthus tricolor]XP_057542741.1 pentatricopeptide repeat-containing protein At4g32450, m